MPPRVWDENLVATFVAAGGITNIASPTAAEVAAGINMSSYIRKNGVSWPNGRGNVDTATIDRRRNTSYPGSESGTLDITFLEENRAGATAPRTSFAGGEVEGFWVFGFEGSNGTAGDPVEVYHVVGDKPTRNNPGPDENQQLTVRFHVQDADEESVIAA